MKTNLFWVAAALAALTACNKTPEKEKTPVDFSQYALRVEPVITRATETNFESGDAVGLTVTRAAGAYATNEKLTYDGAAFSGSLNWYSEGTDEATLKAYYPYSETVPSSFTVAADQSAGTASSDFLSAVKEGVLPTANAVAMVFKHRLSRLVVTVNNLSGAAIESVVFQGAIPTALIADNLTATVDPSANPVDIKAFADGEKYYAILPAQKVTLTAAVTAGGKVLSQQLAEASLETGKQYSVSIVVLKEEIKVVLAGEIENWSEGGEITGGDDDDPVTEEHLDEGYILYGGDRYSVLQLSNGRWIMTQSLRFVPKGKTVSSDPSDGNGLWYPYTSDGTTATPATDAASIEARGLLYDHEVAFGSEITSDNYKTFEGTRGICPEGWHIPTRAEFLAIVGASNKGDGETTAPTDENAIFYDKDYKAGRIKTMNEKGFNWDFAGSISRNNVEATGKYSTVVTKSNTCSVEEWLGKNAVTYYMGSTGYTPTGSDGTTKNRQFMSLMSTFTASFPEGKASIAYTNFRAGYSLRCIRDLK
jgi:uncharacterized protein (TIGR02145 family)